MTRRQVDIAAREKWRRRNPGQGEMAWVRAGQPGFCPCRICRDYERTGKTMEVKRP